MLTSLPDYVSGSRSLNLVLWRREVLWVRVPLPSLICLLRIFIVEFLARKAVSVWVWINGEDSWLLEFSFLIVMLEADSGSKIGFAADEFECLVRLSVMVCSTCCEPFTLIESGNCWMLWVCEPKSALWLAVSDLLFWYYSPSIDEKSFRDKFYCRVAKVLIFDILPLLSCLSITWLKL